MTESVAAALRVTLHSNARLRQANEFSERRVLPARATRERRGKGRQGGAAAPVERPQVDVASVAAGRAARPEEKIAGRDRGADGRREHRLF